MERRHARRARAMVTHAMTRRTGGFGSRNRRRREHGTRTALRARADDADRQRGDGGGEHQRVAAGGDSRHRRKDVGQKTMMTSRQEHLTRRRDLDRVFGISTEQAGQVACRLDLLLHEQSDPSSRAQRSHGYNLITMRRLYNSHMSPKNSKT